LTEGESDYHRDWTQSRIEKKKKKKKKEVPRKRDKVERKRRVGEEE
jgi:hypothetical protein